LCKEGRSSIDGALRFKIYTLVTVVCLTSNKSAVLILLSNTSVAMITW